jgi:uncharacterized protein (TIGR02391 family)
MKDQLNQVLVFAGYQLTDDGKLREVSAARTISEHTGPMSLMEGVFGLFRNPTAHVPRITWSMTEKDAPDVLTMISLTHRRLDQAVRTGK